MCSTFASTNQNNPTPLCPVCSSDTPVEELEVDELVLRLCHALPDGTMVADIKSCTHYVLHKAEDVVSLVDSDDDDVVCLDNAPLATRVPLSALPPAALPTVAGLGSSAEPAMLHHIQFAIASFNRNTDHDVLSCDGGASSCAKEVRSTLLNSTTGCFLLRLSSGRVNR